MNLGHDSRRNIASTMLKQAVSGLQTLSSESNNL